MFSQDQITAGNNESVGIGIGLNTSNILSEALGGCINIRSPIS